MDEYNAVIRDLAMSKLGNKKLYEKVRGMLTPLFDLEKAFIAAMQVRPKLDQYDELMDKYEVFGDWFDSMPDTEESENFYKLTEILYNTIQEIVDEADYLAENYTEGELNSVASYRSRKTVGDSIVKRTLKLGIKSVLVDWYRTSR